MPRHVAVVALDGAGISWELGVTVDAAGNAAVAAAVVTCCILKNRIVRRTEMKEKMDAGDKREALEGGRGGGGRTAASACAVAEDRGESQAASTQALSAEEPVLMSCEEGVWASTHISDT